MAERRRYLPVFQAAVEVEAARSMARFRRIGLGERAGRLT